MHSVQPPQRFQSLRQRVQTQPRPTRQTLPLTKGLKEFGLGLVGDADARVFHGNAQHLEGVVEGW